MELKNAHLGKCLPFEPPKWLEMHLKLSKCHSSLISTATKTVTMAVKLRNFHNMTPLKDANYLKMASHKLPISGK